MANQKKIGSETSRYFPTMTQDYSQISDTAKAIAVNVLPKIITYIQSIAPQITCMHSETPFTIADYGAADGVNSSELFEKIIKQIHSMNSSLKIKLVYIDIANRPPFNHFWKGSKLAQLDYVEAKYIKRSFYEPFPEIAQNLHLGFSSTSLHWLNTKNVDSNFFRHHTHIQANQLSDGEREKFVEKWKGDWRYFFRERSAELVQGGALLLANLTNLGHDQFPASAGYNYLRDICNELYQEKRLSGAELNAIFVPDYFATPEETNTLLNENDLKQLFYLKSCDVMTVPCAYFAQAQNQLDNPQTRFELADTLAHVVRAWSESSIRTGLSSKNKNEIEEIYKRLREKFYETIKGLPYQYCLLELIKK